MPPFATANNRVTPFNSMGAFGARATSCESSEWRGRPSEKDVLVSVSWVAGTWRVGSAAPSTCSWAFTGPVTNSSTRRSVAVVTAPSARPYFSLRDSDKLRCIRRCDTTGLPGCPDAASSCPRAAISQQRRWSSVYRRRSSASRGAGGRCFLQAPRATFSWSRPLRGMIRGLFLTFS